MDKIKRLENWGVVYRGPIDPYMAPECVDVGLCGRIYNHPKHQDGNFVTISRTVSYDPDTRTIETYSGSLYQLGEVDPEYLKLYPDSVEGMHKMLCKLPKIVGK
jgi:hypothetical protein